MSTPIIELIAEDIKDAINSITVSNGYNQDLTAVRPKTVDYSDVAIEDGKVLILQADEDDGDAEPVGCQQWNQVFILSAAVINSENATTSIDTRINQVVSDIRKKLLEDTTRGGYAIDTILKPAMIFSDGEEVTGANISIQVQYRTQYDDPYMQG